MADNKYKKMADKYKNSKIYKITNTDTDDIYIGSTTQKLNRRFSYHKYNCRKNPNYNLYSLMIEKGIDKFNIILLTDYPCNNKKELLVKEQEYMTLLKPVLNKIKATRTITEKKEYQAEYNKNYAIDKKDELKLYKKEWETKKITCGCGKEVRTCKLKRHKLSKYHIKNA
jgi:hypothetical protein